MENLKNIYLKDLKDGENIEMILKRHWITLFYTVLNSLFLIISIILILNFENFLLNIISGSFLYILLVIYISIFLLVIYISWMKYELDLFIITNKRIVGIEQKSFLDRIISECNLKDVQEINARTTGLLSNLLDYGAVNIHTASEKSEFEMKFLPDPFENQRKITNIINEYKNGNDKI